MSFFSDDLVNNLQKINFTSMTDVQLSKWLRSQYKFNGDSYGISLSTAISFAKCLKLAYRLGETRAKAVN